MPIVSPMVYRHWATVIAPPERYLCGSSGEGEGVPLALVFAQSGYFSDSLICLARASASASIASETKRSSALRLAATWSAMLVA